MPLSGWSRWTRVTLLAVVVAFFAAVTLFLGGLRDTAAKFDLSAADDSAATAHQDAKTFVVKAAPLSQVDADEPNDTTVLEVDNSSAPR
jgi:dTDP-4-dehydrorhamnose reductase